MKRDWRMERAKRVMLKNQSFVESVAERGRRRQLRHKTEETAETAIQRRRFLALLSAVGGE